MKSNAARSTRSIFTPDTDAAVAAGALSGWVINEIDGCLLQLAFVLENILPEPLRIDEEFLLALMKEEEKAETDEHPFHLATVKDTEQLKRRLGIVAWNAIYFAELAASARADEEAMNYVTRSIYEQAFIDGAAAMHAGKTMMSEFARKGAKASKSESAKMKASLFGWLVDNFKDFRSVDAAAMRAIRIEPISYRTAVTWIKEWKELREVAN